MTRKVSGETGLSEAKFQGMVIDLARLFGWRVAHFRPSRTKDGWVTAVSADGKGFPDLFLVRARTGHAIAAELKVGNNRPTPEQATWLAALNAGGIPAFTWWPHDWPEIETVLRDGADR